MKMNQKIFALGFALTLSLIQGSQYFSEAFWHKNSLYAQDNKYPYKQYDDRKEGIVRNGKLVAGEKLALVAAVIANHESSPQNGVNQYHLGFYLKAPAKLSIEVREFEKRYKMEPLEKDWKSGLQQFAWSAEIPRYYDIGLKDLFPLAKISGSLKTQIVPVLLYHLKPQFSEVSYNFYFVAQDEISVLVYKIYDSQTETPRLVYADTLRDLRAHERISVRWRGKDRNNLAVKSGWYSLFLEASFKLRPLVVSEYQFYHHAGLLQE